MGAEKLVEQQIVFGHELVAVHQNQSLPSAA